MQQKKSKTKNVKRFPKLLSENQIFRKLIQNRHLKYRDYLYKVLDAALGDFAKEPMTYRTWFTTPNRIPVMENSLYLKICDCLIAAYKHQCDDMRENFNEINTEYRNETKR